MARTPVSGPENACILAGALRSFKPLSAKARPDVLNRWRGVSRPATQQPQSGGDMALHHAAPGEIVNLATWADDIPGDHSKAIAKTSEMELARLVMREGDVMEDKHVDGPLVVHCLSGCLEIDALGQT